MSVFQQTNRSFRSQFQECYKLYKEREFRGFLRQFKCVLDISIGSYVTLYMLDAL